MSEHTPGPWSWEEHTSGFDVFHGEDSSNERDHFVARCDTEANARLIAAAPDLLEALERIEELVGGECYCHDSPGPEECECDNTHAQNETVCRFCWNQGIRHSADDDGPCAHCEARRAITKARGGAE